jgi:carbamoyltransferase
MIVLGISVGHDAAACLLIDGIIVANAAEERFSRIKHVSGFPAAAINYCLEEAGIASRDIDVAVISGRHLPPGIERRFILTPQQAAELAAARQIGHKAVQLLIKPETRHPPLYFPRIELSPHCTLLCIEHHLCHAAAAHFTRGRDDQCLIVTIDGIGDDVSVAIWLGEQNKIQRLAEWGRNASLGWFYGIVTEALGWQHGDGEGKTMALAAYGDAAKVGSRLEQFHPAFSEGQLVRPHEFGTPSYVSQNGIQHWHFPDAERIRAVADDCGVENVAAYAQTLIEREVLGIVHHWKKARNLKRLACAGGVFLNVKVNQRIWYESELEEHWIFPDAGDSGLAMGAALYAWHTMARQAMPKSLEHLYYGPAFTDEFVRGVLDTRRICFREIANPSYEAATKLAQGEIVGWFQGRMEFGPRALGNRSILMSPTNAKNKDILNSRVKFREEFRPFCPSLLFDRMDDYLVRGRTENFMITSFEAKPEMRQRIPAAIHVDGTVRPQTVRLATNPRYYQLIEYFGEHTGVYAVLNTSFNVKGEPMVCHPRDAIRCFFDTGLDALIIGNLVLEKSLVNPADRQ